MSFWNFGILSFWILFIFGPRDFGILGSEVCGFLTIFEILGSGDSKFLAFWHFGFSEFWVFGLLEFWVFGIILFWVFGNLTFWVFGILDFCDL